MYTYITLSCKALENDPWLYLLVFFKVTVLVCNLALSKDRGRHAAAI